MDYLRFGSGSQTLVILPGLSVKSVMESADAVAEAYAVMTERYTVYLFDRRRELPRVYPISDMAADTAEAMKTLCFSYVDMFGASQGGMIAMEMAVRYPDMIRMLALGSTASDTRGMRSAAIERWVNLARAGDREALWLDFGAALYPQDVMEQIKSQLIAAARATTDEELERFIVLATGTEGFSVTERLDRIKCPVLLLNSDDDRVLGPDAADDIARAFAGRSDFECFTYHGFGHAAYDSAPDYKERLLDFFRG